MYYLFISLVSGYVASACHGISAEIMGDKDNLQSARRAATSSMKSTLVTGGTTGCALLGPAGKSFG